MSDKNLARRAKLKLYIGGADISGDVSQYLISLTYTDNESDETDDLQLKLHDRDDVWLQEWLNPMVQSAAASEYETADAAGGKPYTVKVNSSLNVRSGPGTGNRVLGSLTNGTVVYVSEIANGWATISYDGKTAYVYASYLAEGGSAASTSDSTDAKGLRMQAVIVRENWLGDGEDKVLDCGEFELDDISGDGPPATLTIKGTSLPYRATIRKAEKSKAWEGYTLSGIVAEMAGGGGMGYVYESATDPYFERVEQISQSDISFLQELCEQAGIALKATANLLVLFDKQVYEEKAAVRTIAKGDKSYLKYKYRTGKADTEFDACHVSYTDPETSKTIEYTYKLEDADEEDEDYQVLEIREKVTTEAEAQMLAKKMLRLKNEFAYTMDFTLPGDPDMVAGITIDIQGFGMFSGKYIISQAKHSVSGSGYTTQISLRHVLEGY